MPVIGDSSAILEFEKMLPQHQAAITLMNSVLQNPLVDKVNWLDLACGKGQIISQLNENLTLENRKKITYYGYDINVDYTKIVSKIADNLNFMDYVIHIGDLSSFDNILPKDLKFDFITCTNVTHEIHPQKFLEIILGVIKRLNAYGQLFLYDMESLSNPELGALPLKASDIKRLVETILRVAGSDFKVCPSTWSHRTCKGWSLVINRNYLGVSNDNFVKSTTKILDALHNEIGMMLNMKLTECKQVLDTFTSYGTETSDEEEQKMTSLYEFWSLHKALEDLI
ncbi:MULTISPECIES: methyltransferase domain-containing protein [Lachnospiraceae]|uniref:methyltransferase domain-containing protein n=1 Tax=Lachnospiraceae TaxID=186803 RepID=UPI000673AFAA|nr:MULTISPECIES: methyltransferase domain-containing protein [Lachnospiraceae]MCB6201001.1 class I SAM-dependent methyltransferase [Extibacter muris]MCQ4662331.1 class I SAM-dependent methyltransferase [Extibacter muris]MCQ4691742.1 class I SAM-dependent methyltransferase [Extibacter muris]